MITSTIQIVFLMATAGKLSSFDKRGRVYRPLVSLVATIWAGSCMALSVAIAIKFPERVSVLDIVGCVFAVVSFSCAWYFGGNVASLLRALKLIRD
jgi:hypothetical protein